MALKAVHHIALLVSDYQKSKEFYVDKLGFRIVRENSGRTEAIINWI